MNPPRVLVDVTQFANWPATSGIQRVIMHLARDWSGTWIDARFGFLARGRYATGPISALGEIIAGVFRAEDAGEAQTPAAVQSALYAVSDFTVSAAAVEDSFAAYLLPEPTLRGESLAVARRVVAKQRSTTFFVYFDALPLTHPQFYPGGADRDGIVTRYHGVVAQSDNVAFISQYTRSVFEQRIARRKLVHAVVTRPGADGLPRIDPVPPKTPTFVVLGTIEPRKRHRLVLEAFECLWDAGCEYRLIVLGAWGWEQPDLQDRLRHHAAAEQLQWIARAGDSDVANALASSTAVIFIPYAEGYGLPPVEALAAGIPVITVADLPSLDGLPADGQIRLRIVDADALGAAVESLADPSTNAQYRASAKKLDLPTWAQFAREIETWIASALLDGHGAGKEVQEG